jgi:hypothetical protein
MAALIDPFGVQTFVYMTRYWTPTEQNSLVVPFEDVMLYNRIIWLSIAGVVLLITWWQFSFTSKRGFVPKTKKALDVDVAVKPVVQLVSITKPRSVIKQLISTTLFHFRSIWIEVPFIAIVGTGFIVLLVNVATMGNMFGTSSYPVTSTVITMLGSFSLFFIIIMIFYSGEIIWKERQHKFHSIIDAVPADNWIILLSKFLGLCLVYASILFGFLVFGILLQLRAGYFHFDLSAYGGSLFAETFVNLCLATVVSMLIQTLAGNKFLGFVLTITFFILVVALPTFGLKHEMFSYGSGTLGSYSQMNGFGHFTSLFVWLKTYWIAFATLLFIPAVILYTRGVENRIRVKWRTGSRQVKGGMKAVAIAGAVTYFGSGMFIYFNTNVLNSQQGVEKKKEALSRPKIVEVDLSIDIDPAKRSFEAKGFYYVKDSTGDSLRKNFKSEYKPRGFRSKPQNTDVVYNGTFIKSDSLHPLSGGKIRFKAVVSTDGSQVAIAPGRLVKDWYENNRHYFQYEADEPMSSKYAIFSGEYEIKRDNWNNIDLEIYYHKTHYYNVDRMMQAMKAGLDYYTRNFGPLHKSQIRIVEFPKYTTAAQSFPGILAISEGAGFLLKINKADKDLDVPYYSIAHELAHQWWDTGTFSEGLSQYSALMIVKHTLPPEQLQLYLKYELDAYMKGRTAEKKKEPTLLSATDQQYVTFNKSALAFFALQDYVGEDSINSALNKFYATPKDLIKNITDVTPDSLRYLISDLFEHITMYENKVAEAAYRSIGNGRFELTLTANTQKLQVDLKGQETRLPINEWIDVGVYGEDSNGQPTLIYFNKHKFDREKNTITIVTQQQPIQVGIDPFHKLIDRHANDNVIPVGAVVELANAPLGN